MTNGDRTSIDRLPHRAPFLFLTSIQEMSAGEHAKAIWSLSGDEAFFAGHFPGNPIVPGVLIAEALAQLAGLLGDRGEYADAKLASVNVRFKAPVRPPAVIELHASRRRAIGPLWLFDVRAVCDGSEAASGTVTLGFEQTRGTAPGGA